MTKTNATALLILLTLCLVPTPAQADDGPAKTYPPLPQNVVARVSGRDMTFDGLCTAAAQQKVHELTNAGSAEASTLRQLMEEYIVQQEAQRLGVDVTSAIIDQRFDENDRRLRERSGGTKNLRQVMREQGMAMDEMRLLLAHQLRQEAIARHPENLGDTLPENEAERLSQLKVVLDKVVRRTEKKYYVATGFDKTPAVNGGNNKLIASVRVHPSMPEKFIDKRAFGRALVLRLSTGAVRGILDRECKTGLMAAAGVGLTDAQFDEEIALKTRIWEVERMLASQAAFSEVTYPMYIEAHFGIKIEQMKRQRYYRGFFGLLRRFRGDVTEKDIREEYEKGKESTWGPYILVSAISVEFRQEKARFAQRSLRHKKQAVKIVHDLTRQLAAGVPFTDLVRTVNAEIKRRRDPSMRAGQRRLRSTDADFQLYKEALVMKDGQISRPIETLAHMHLLKRERAYPAPTYDQIRPVLRELLARKLARNWLEDQIKEPEYVRIRWPLPQRGGETK